MIRNSIFISWSFFYVYFGSMYLFLTNHQGFFLKGKIKIKMNKKIFHNHFSWHDLLIWKAYQKRKQFREIFFISSHHHNLYLSSSVLIHIAMQWNPVSCVFHCLVPCFVFTLSLDDLTPYQFIYDFPKRENYDKLTQNDGTNLWMWNALRVKKKKKSSVVIFGIDFPYTHIWFKGRADMCICAFFLMDSNYLQKKLFIHFLRNDEQFIIRKLIFTWRISAL